MKTRILSLAAVGLAGALAFAPAAQAATITTANVLTDTSSLGILNLDGFALGSAPLANPVPGVTSITFDGTSGLYSGDIGGQTRSPIRDSAGTATTAKYFNARNDTDGVTVTYSDPQSSLHLLWGSVDWAPVDYNTIQFIQNGVVVDSITGAELAAHLSLALPQGREDVEALITSDDWFDSVKFTATQEAFEFALFAPTSVPEPGALTLLGAGLLGLAAYRRRRN